jgi:hypothetical protein
MAKGETTGSPLKPAITEVEGRNVSIKITRRNTQFCSKYNKIGRGAKFILIATIRIAELILKIRFSFVSLTLYSPGI